MAKVVRFNDEARAGLKKGVDLIANAIKTTLGPRGRNVVYGFHYGYPVATKDGVTVARQIEAKDQHEQLGVLLVREAAQKTADDAGDGTTTASVLAQSIFNEGLKSISRGANPILIKRGIDMAVADVIQFIDGQKIMITEDKIHQVATISANNDSFIGNLIKEAVSKVGKDGVITLDDNYQSTETYIETVEGMQLNEGLLSPYFVTDQMKMEAVYTNPFILVVDEVINHIKPLMGILEKVIAGEKRPIIIIAHNITGNALQTLVYNRVKQGVQVLAVKCPNFGSLRSEMLQDIARFTGATVMGSGAGFELDKAEVRDCGQCESITSTRHFTTILGGKGRPEDISARIEQIKYELDNCENDYDKQKLEERLAKLTSGVAVIRIGAFTEVEQKEKKMRVEDALHASRAALEDGIVAGGGVMLLRAAYQLQKAVQEMSLADEELIGYKIVINALKDPIRQIAFNSGLDGSEIIAQILPVDNVNYGYNFLTNKLGNMIDMGVIDPTKVVKLSLQNGASVAGMLLTTEVAIYETIEDEVMRTPKPKSE